MSTYLGIDIGTSSVIALLMNGDQAVLGHAAAPLSVIRARLGWSEQDPSDWWRALETCIDTLRASHRSELAAVAGIGLSGQMHGATLLDEADLVLRPCILWNDGRAVEQCTKFETECPRSRAISGNPAMPGFTAPKLLWLRENEPDLFNRTKTVLLPKDYVRLLLTGEKVSEMSDASGTLWLDVANRDWSDDLLSATGLSRDHMPRLVEGSAPSGQLRAELAERWGMSRAPAVAGGGGDNAASACGLGVIAPGSGFVSIGTSGVLFAANERFTPNTDNAVHAFCHAVPETWHQMGVILSAGASLEWLAGIVGSDAATLVGGLGDTLCEPSSLGFLPYLAGERTPHNDSAIRGGFAGLDAAMTRVDLTHAVLQGVAFAFQDSFDALTKAGATIDKLYAVGGGSKSRLWLTMIATTMNVPIEVPAASDMGAAFGAARLGMAAATGIDPLQICVPPMVLETAEPVAALTPAYQAAWQRYRSLYPAMKEALSS